jgi:hypothetical protein
MEIKKVLHKSLLILSVILASIFSIVFAFSLIAFVLNINDKGMLQFFVVSSLICALLWGSTFFIASVDKSKSKEERIQIIKDLIAKMPLILLSSVITSVYTLIYFFFFGFLTVSDYGDGGWGGDAANALIFVFLGIAILIISIVMYKVFKTDKQDISLTIFNQFMVLKWSSLIALPFGIWSAYYFYHEQGTEGWFAMILWSLLLYGVYVIMKKISKKVHNSITDSNLNRIIHEKKKKMVAGNEEKQQITEKNKSNLTVADELKKLQELLTDGVLTQNEFDTQKKRLLE